MKDPQVANAIEVIKKACASVVADLENHQIIQNAITTVMAALDKPEEDRALAKVKKTEKTPE